MRVLDISLESPAENLAFDEVLLNNAEDGDGTEALRFWESPALFVVLGVSQPLNAHVNEDACRRDGVPIMRRCSAGGCVVQGPGSLNYSLVLRHDRHPDIGQIRASYCYILHRLEGALARRGVPAKHEGISDLAVAGGKISGNSQRRRRSTILHHGTLLHGLDPALMTRYLREPEDRPSYRGGRTHEDFVGRLALSSDELKAAVREAFDAPAGLSEVTENELTAVRHLAAQKYAADPWIRRR